MDIKDLFAQNLDFTVNMKASTLKEFLTDIEKSFEKQKPQEKHTSPQLLTADKVCEIFSISRVTLWDWDKKGMTKPIRLGNLKRYRLSDIEELLKDKKS